LSFNSYTNTLFTKTESFLKMSHGGVNLEQESRPLAFSTNNILNRNFRGARRRTDSKWSWVVCVCGLVTNIVVIGCSGSFGVLFPAILEEFKAGKGLTGESMLFGG
jgi:hypothetical protein